MYHLIYNKGDLKIMKHYKSNIQDYIEPEFLEEETYKLGDELAFLPEEEVDANFCQLESIVSNGEDFTVNLAIENEWTGERYKKTYQVKEGSELEMNKLLPNLACFLPPSKVPIMVKITAISAETLALKPIGILEEYAADMDKKTNVFETKA